ncbi:hypothetical protein TDB9533_03039 [Thalassocella blandensis]|nr:hypothetical protein TDB9533_03039 [Thalassocella blandensis]
MSISFNLVNYSTPSAANNTTSVRESNATAATSGPDAAMNVTNEAAMTGADAETSVAISDSAKRMSHSDSVYIMNTSKGDRAIDFNTYFEVPLAPVDLDSIPLLLPTGENVKNLQAHISKVFPNFLQQHNIPEAPATIKFNNEGQLVLPKDYPYAEELKAALADSPNMMRVLQTANALASHVAALQDSIAFNEAYSKTTTQAEMDAIINQYRHLFNDNRKMPEMALQFSSTGELTITANNQNVV